MENLGKFKRLFLSWKLIHYAKNVILWLMLYDEKSNPITNWIISSFKITKKRKNQTTKSNNFYPTFINWWINIINPTLIRMKAYKRFKTWFKIPISWPHRLCILHTNYLTFKKSNQYFKLGPNNMPKILNIPHYCPQDFLGLIFSLKWMLKRNQRLVVQYIAMDWFCILLEWFKKF
jgi:hypothetical protein